MKRTRVAAAVAAGVVTAALVTTVPAGAQALLPAPEVTPTSGPIGTTITVSGGDCVDGLVDVALARDMFTIVDGVSVQPAADGTWTAQLEVFDTMIELDGGDGIELDVVPGGYFVAALCTTGDDPEGPGSISYDPVAFEVTGGGPSTPPATPPAPAPEAPQPDLVPLAQPAVPVVADPTFAG